MEDRSDGQPHRKWRLGQRRQSFPSNHYVHSADLAPQDMAARSGTKG